MATNAKLARLIGCAAILLASCGETENLVSQDGPIENAAVEAGMTQAQGAPGPEGPTFETEDLQIELDGETVEISDLEDLEELENFAFDDALTLANCVALLNDVPSLDVEQCSYAPDAEEVIVDQLAPGVCENGDDYVVLNRLDGSGAYIGVIGEGWVELSEQQLSLETVELICLGATG